MAIAFAIASGARPEQGLYTAIVAGLLTSLLGGSRVQIGGPTGAFVVIIFSIIQQFGYDGLAVATLIAGLILLVVGFVGLGVVIKFIPYPVTVGFTSGIALVLLTSQVRDFLGLQMDSVPIEFLQKISAYAANIASINLWAVIIGILALVIILLGGFKWMTSGGNEEGVGSAKKTIAAGVVGLAIILFAYAIVAFIFNVIGGVK